MQYVQLSFSVTSRITVRRGRDKLKELGCDTVLRDQGYDAIEGGKKRNEMMF
jgi:hypothetical protein